MIEGFYSEDWVGRPVFVKGHFVTQKIDVMKEKGLSSLQADLGPQLKRLEIGEREGRAYVLVVDFRSRRVLPAFQLHATSLQHRFIHLSLLKAGRVTNVSVGADLVAVAYITCFKLLVRLSPKSKRGFSWPLQQIQSVGDQSSLQWMARL